MVRGLRRGRLAVAASVMCFAGMVAACGSSSSSGGGSGGTATASTSGGNAASAKPLKVAMVYAGPVDDDGWDASWQLAVAAAEKQFGNKVAITYKANVADGPQDQVVFTQLINEGYKAIFATSFGQQQAALALAKAHPDVKFFVVESAKTLPNLASYDYQGADGFYIAGMATAAIARTNTLGFVAAFPIPTSLAQINAFELGAQQIKPGVHTRVVWTNNWFDLSASQKAAQALVSSGSSGLAYLTTGSAIAQVAHSTNTLWNGFEVDQRKFASSQYVTAPLLQWTPYMTSQIKALLAGNWKTGSYLATMANGGIGVAPFGSAYSKASAQDKAKIKAAIAGLKSGKKYVFTGPIVSQAGKTIVASGQREGLPQIYTTNYLVKGVIGTIPAAK